VEIFAIKFGSWVKSLQIVHVFGPRNFLGEGPRVLDLHYKIGADSDQNFAAIGRRNSEILVS